MSEKTMSEENDFNFIVDKEKEKQETKNNEELIQDVEILDYGKVEKIVRKVVRQELARIVLHLKDLDGKYSNLGAFYSKDKTQEMINNGKIKRT